MDTDAGQAFAKLLGGNEGPHILACELVGTQLAALLGLPVLDWVLLDYAPPPELKFKSGAEARAGTAWITRKVNGFVWGGDKADLQYIHNQPDIARLVLLDQWTRNCDRYRPPPRLRVNQNNVYLCREGAPAGKLVLMAMDHTHILTCGAPLGRDLAKIDFVKDATAFGLFPEFEDSIRREEGIIRREDAAAAADTLAAVSDQALHDIVSTIPTDWDVAAPVRAAMEDFLRQRRDWLANRFVNHLFPQGELF